MNNFTNLHTARKSRLQARTKAVTLCGSGFHKWQIAKHTEAVRFS